MNTSSNSKQKTEIIYCTECQKEITIEHLEDGSIIVRCPKCIGECLTCDCHLAQECFSGEENVKVVHPDTGS